MSLSRSGGAQPTKGTQEMRRPTNGLSSQRKSQAPAGWGWRRCSDRAQARAMPFPRSLAHLKREISDRNPSIGWGRASSKKHRMPSRHKPDGMVADSSKRLASRFC